MGQAVTWFERNRQPRDVKEEGLADRRDRLESPLAQDATGEEGWQRGSEEVLIFLRQQDKPGSIGVT